MSDDAPKRRIRGFDVVAMVGLGVGVLGLLLASVNTYFQFFHSRDSVLVFVRDMEIHIGRSVEASLVFVNNGTEQATILDINLQTVSEDGKAEYGAGNLHWVEYDGQRHRLPASITPGTTKIMTVKLTLLPSDFDERISKRMVVYLQFEVAGSAGRVTNSRFHLFNLVDTPKKLDVEGPRDANNPHQLFAGMRAKGSGIEIRQTRGKFYGDTH
jgi:hypothetical protein